MVMLGNEPQLSWSYRGMSPGARGRFSTHLQTGGSLKSDHLSVSHSPMRHPRMAEVVTRSEEGGYQARPRWSGPSSDSESLQEGLKEILNQLLAHPPGAPDLVSTNTLLLTTLTTMVTATIICCHTAYLLPSPRILLQTIALAKPTILRSPLKSIPTNNGPCSPSRTRANPHDHFSKVVVQQKQYSLSSSWLVMFVVAGEVGK